MSAWARVAEITKTRNLEGSVVARSADGLPFLLFPGLQVHFVPPTLKGPRSARVVEVHQLKEDSFEVSFDGVGTIDDAESIAGCFCLAAKSDLPAIEAADEPVSWLDYVVEDERLGDLGSVVEVQSSPAQSLLAVEGPRGSVMIPVVDAFVIEADTANRTVRVRIPDGLLHLEDGDGA